MNRYAGRKDFGWTSPTARTCIKTTFTACTGRCPGEKAIEEILHKTGKTHPEQELNCGSCGYSTCREKAIAVYQGKADLTMCLPFLTEKARVFSDTIINNTPNGIIVSEREPGGPADQLLPPAIS